MAAPGIISYPELQKLCRPDGPAPRLATVERWARKSGIRIQYDGQGGVWTTMTALDAALGIGSAASNESYPAELI